MNVIRALQLFKPQGIVPVLLKTRKCQAPWIRKTGSHARHIVYEARELSYSGSLYRQDPASACHGQFPPL